MDIVIIGWIWLGILVGVIAGFVICSWLTQSKVADLESEITHANTSKSCRELGYEPKIDYKTGLKQFIDWYNEYYKK